MAEEYPRRWPILKERDIEWLRLVSLIGAKYGYRLIPDPQLRTSMPVKMMRELGYTIAAAEFEKRRRYET